MHTDLRLILLIVGLVIVGAIFFDGVKRRKNLEENNRTVDPSLDPADSRTDLNSVNYDDLLEDPIWTPRPVTKKELIVDNIIAINVIAKSQLGFSGKALLSVMLDNQLQYGAKKTYDYCAQDTDDVLYSVASIVEPGTFDTHTIAQKNYPGIMLFVLINSVDDSLFAFEEMLKAAYDMAAKLNAQVCNLERQPLSQEQIEQLRLHVQDRTLA